VARIQAGVFPDILIYDELLDSSLDDDSLSVLLDIISRKQKEDDNKVYIISHRNEISEIEAANTIRVVKEGGYSKCLMT
jgi:Fe-S cluster assembly ATPase SufC